MRAPSRRQLTFLLLASTGMGLGLWSGRRWIAAGLRPLRVDQRLRLLAEPIRAAALESDLDPYMLAGLVFVESSASVDAVSSADALGLCQLKLSTAAEQARRMGLPEPTRRQLLTDAGLNLRLGAGYLARQMGRQEGSFERALMAYNTGPTRFERWLREAGGYRAWRAEVDAEGPPGPGSVRTYARKVREQGERLRSAGLLEPVAAQDRD